MATDYNATLIVDLYTTSDVEKATHIADEMSQIGDSIFPRQIYEAYKRFQHTASSHYFVSDLTTFKSADSAEILKEIALNSERPADIEMMIDYLTKIEYFDTVIVEKLKRLFINSIISGRLSEYDVDSYFSYFEKSNKDVSDLVPFLKTCFEDGEKSMDLRQRVLNKLLKLNPKEYLNYYYDNYEVIKSGKKTEIIFVNEVSSWSGGIIPKIHEKIMESGSARAKEILSSVLEKKSKKIESEKKEQQKEIKEQYSTSDVINEIAKARSAMNTIGRLDERFGFDFLSVSEDLYQQGRPANSKETLVGYCIVLRSIFGGYGQKVLEFEISEERARELIPDIKELKGPLNRFHLLLLEKGVKVDSSIWGLRNLNRVVSKFAHPAEESSPEFSKILKEEGLLDLYTDGNWSLLHREILLKYKSALEKAIVAIKER